jgi:predicted lipase
LWFFIVHYSFLGHSLGGALSIFCAMDLVTQKIVPGNRISVINFGQPRVGNKAFADYFNKQNIFVARYALLLTDLFSPSHMIESRTSETWCRMFR